MLEKKTSASKKSMESVQRKEERVYGQKDFWRWVLSREWKSEWVKNGKSGKSTAEDEVTDVGRGDACRGRETGTRLMDRY